MNKKIRLLIINPGSTSTKISVFDNEELVVEKTLRHSNEELAPYATILDQYEFRMETILEVLNENNIELKELDCIVGRGGLLKPMESGTYRVNEKMLNDLINAPMMQHASNLGAIIADKIAKKLNIPAFIVDPIVVDEMEDIARLTGVPEIERICIFHALNQKAVARRAAEELKKNYEDLNLILVHLGGGISVGAHKKGRIIDVNNALNGDGAFSPERAGSLPVGSVIEMCFSGKYTHGQLNKKFVGNAGLVAHLGTNDGRVVGKMIESGDAHAELVYKALAYNIAKEIGAAATVLCGDIDAICITGGLAYDSRLTDWIKERVSFIAEVRMYPGEDEMIALAQGGLRVMNNLEKEKVY